MRILILGGSGFIGLPMAHFLQNKGHDISITTRSKNINLNNFGINIHKWDGLSVQTLLPILSSHDVVINLVGKNIAQARWTKANKEKILQSRILASKALKNAWEVLFKNNQHFPQTLIQASACGYYGSWQDYEKAPLCTENRLAGEGFLAKVCQEWEKHSLTIQQFGVRCCILRLAPVIGRKFSLQNLQNQAVGGFLAPMITPFKFFLGGNIGSGLQPVSWIHRNDLMRAVYFLIQNKSLDGIFNLSAPHDVNMNQLIQTIANVLNRPSWLSMPAGIMRLLIGEMAEELILTGQRVIPQRLLTHGFHFRYENVKTAVQSCVG